MHRIALAVARGAAAGKARPRDPSGETAPRTYVFDEAFSPNWDESILDGGESSGMLPRLWRMSRRFNAAGRIRRGGHVGREDDSVDADAAAVAGAGKPHVAMMYQFEKPNLRLLLGALKKNLHAVVTWSSVQRRALIERIGFPSGRVYLIRHYVDQVFYSPRPSGDDMICAVGAEMRDYATLVEAVRGNRPAMPPGDRSRAGPGTGSPSQ